MLSPSPKLDDLWHWMLLETEVRDAVETLMGKTKHTTATKHQREDVKMARRQTAPLTPHMHASALFLLQHHLTLLYAGRTLASARPLLLFLSLPPSLPLLNLPPLPLFHCLSSLDAALRSHTAGC